MEPPVTTARNGTSPRAQPPAAARTPSLVAIQVLVHLAAWVPFALLVWDATHDGLGADPVASITHRSGDWALRLLLLTLAITPLRRATGWTSLTRLRRPLGLYAFFYACVHFATYLVLDLGGYWAQIGEELVKRPYILVGFLAWLGLVPLALTSTKALMRRLGRNWLRLHRIVYAIAILAVTHYLWLVKADLREPLLYAGILALLLLLRFPPVARRITRSRVVQRGA
jgi:sulfoxide reductase heme-binding subunit YedZ